MSLNPLRRQLVRTSTAAAALVTLCALGAVAVPVASAQDWPARPVRIMVGASAGGGTDVIARLFAEKLSESTRQSFVVENRPGASNTIAADLTAKAPADGHTLLVATNTGQAIAPHLLKLAYDPLASLEPIGLIVVVPNVLLVNPAVPASDVRNLVALMKASPGGFRYASSGVGSTQHLAGEAFDLAAGTRATHVPYKGSSQAHVDLIGGQVQMMFDTTSSSMPHIKSGKLRALAVMSPQRSPELPDVPTLAEAGLPGVEMTTWYGMFATGGTPPAVLAKLRAEFERAMALPEVAARLRSLGGEPGTLDVEGFAAFNRAEFERFGKLIRDAGVKVEK
ncbi:Bug family tripartite tricarboxylate transporter substrate binding protein [Zeimonas arvi]|uniref:Tripartite tricarboxylate transporter substrate binding protein n=1 Tax=Zeimonas arvi TaxID=2498847 RepID=A0A5C8NR53_9BURK|nr:tripartite tricarboxylate transporter substrate binding protein [Zeimonas arvi]TXL63748.1 tripartite tricarboxylate transporter substrate binding protein [Zeimonas arvi]